MVAMCDCYFTPLFFKEEKKKKEPAFYLFLIFVPVLCGFQFVEGMSEKESGRVGREQPQNTTPVGSRCAALCHCYCLILN